MFDAKPKVHDAAGNVPLNYQPDLLDPLGRTIMISFRKLFLPPPSFFRQQFQRAPAAAAASAARHADFRISQKLCLSAAQ